MFRKCAETTLNSKLISGHKAFFAEMVTKAVMTLGEGMPLKMIGIKKVTGGAVTRARFMTGCGYRLLASANSGELVLGCIEASKQASTFGLSHFASKHSLESPRRDLHNALLCTVLKAPIFV